MNTLTCAYCGQRYPDQTPASGSQVLTDHIKVCEKHPMRELEQKYTRVRNALVGLVGDKDKETLIGMEAEMGVILAHVPTDDLSLMREAIRVLIETAE